MSPAPAQNATDQAIMRACLALASRGAGRVSPNPMVGAVLTDRRGRVVATGYHRVFGGPHAEVVCLDSYRGKTTDATLYVSLEPCVHHGKTPPCVERIIRAGIPRVVVAMRDPNPRVAGRGIAALRRAGIAVRVGVCEAEAHQLNRHFVRHITARRPYVHMKIAQTLDGKIAARPGQPTSISSGRSQTLVHRWRATHDAVLVGAGTVRADNPSLTVRRVRGRNPDVVILDGGLRLSPAARVFRDTRSRRVFVFTTSTRDPRRRRLIRRLSLGGVVVMELPAREGRLSLGTVLKVLHAHDVGSVLVEGGGGIFTQFAGTRFVDELSIFLAPSFLPGGVPAFGGDVRVSLPRARPGSLRVCMVGRDVLVNVRWGSRTKRTAAWMGG